MKWKWSFNEAIHCKSHTSCWFIKGRTDPRAKSSANLQTIQRYRTMSGIVEHCYSPTVPGWRITSPPCILPIQLLVLLVLPPHPEDSPQVPINE